MTLSLISLALLNSISIPNPGPNNPYFPIHPPVCNTLDNYSCVTSYYCGWCDNSSYTDDDDDDFFRNSTHPHPYLVNGTCIPVGYCGIGTVFGENCDNVIMTNACFFVRVGLLAFFLIICINLVFCVIKGVHAPLLKSNYSSNCKRTTAALLYSLMFIPLMTFYFINFTVFIYLLFSCTILGIVFWSCYGGSFVVKVVNNMEYNRNRNNTEDTPLLVNGDI